MASKNLDDLTAQCIRCGFCLEACPTFQVTGDETESPRGRIYLVRSALAGTIPLAEAKTSLDHCLGCRACEPACPSGVEYGQILELARSQMQHERPDWKKERLLELLTGRIVGIATRLGRVVGALPQRRSVPTATENQRAAKGEVCLLEGCVMRHMYPGVHQATRNLLGDVGFSVAAVDLGCCGALHAHNGFLGKGERMAAQVATLAQGRPIVVNSAGCGSHLKSCGVDAPDISEFLLEHGLVEKLRLSKGLLGTATYHDACHLCHGQGIRNAPRELLAAIPGLKVVPLPFSDRCCGSAGIYNILQPKMAKELQERKVDTILESGAEMVILGNPGCDAWIQKGLVRRGSRVRVLHLAELLNQALHA